MKVIDLQVVSCPPSILLVPILSGTVQNAESIDMSMVTEDADPELVVNQIMFEYSDIGDELRPKLTQAVLSFIKGI